jgi:hypothetical protein
LSAFRRKIVKDPLLIFIDKLKFLEFCSLINKLKLYELDKIEDDDENRYIDKDNKENGVDRDKLKSSHNSRNKIIKTELQEIKDYVFNIILSHAEIDLADNIAAYHTLCSTSGIDICLSIYIYIYIYLTSLSI